MVLQVRKASKIILPTFWKCDPMNSFYSTEYSSVRIAYEM